MERFGVRGKRSDCDGRFMERYGRGSPWRTTSGRVPNAAGREVRAGMINNKSGTEHKKHKSEHKRHKKEVKRAFFCAFCVRYVPFVLRSRPRCAKPRLSIWE